MHQIQKIDRVGPDGVLQDFEWPRELPNFTRYNIVYGWNGTGKSILSRLLARLSEPPMGNASASATLTVDDRQLSLDELASHQPMVRVFNRDYIDGNLAANQQKGLAPVYNLGSDQVSASEQFAQLEEQLSDKRANLNDTERELKTKERALRRHCTANASMIKDRLRSAGSNSYNNYDIRNYESAVQRALQSTNSEDYVLDESRIDELNSIINHDRMEKLEELSFSNADINELHSSTLVLIKKSVTTETVQDLESDSEVSDWIHRGLELHQARLTSNCLYCERALPGPRVDALARHFSEAYQKHFDALDLLIARVTEKRQSAPLVPPNKNLIYSSLRTQYSERCTAAQASLETIDGHLQTLSRLLTEKRQYPLRVVDSPVGDPPNCEQELEDLNKLLRQHNHRCEEHDTEAASSREAVEMAHVAKCCPEFIQLRDDVEASRVTCDRQRGELDELAKEVGDIRQKLVQHHSFAEDLNNDLVVCRGFV